MICLSSRAEQSYEPVAVIREGGLEPLVEIRNTFELLPLTIVAMKDEEGRDVFRANPGNRVILITNDGSFTFLSV
jgi:hypothetical protein